MFTLKITLTAVWTLNPLPAEYRWNKDKFNGLVAWSRMVAVEMVKMGDSEKEKAEKEDELMDWAWGGRKRAQNLFGS